MVQDWGIAGQPGSDDVITGRRSGTKANGGNQAKTIGAWCAFCHIEERFYCKWRSRVDGCVRVVGIDG